jgi:hypothetical protein
MNRNQSFKPAVCGFDQFDQAVELRRLRQFADQASTEQIREYINNNLECIDQAAGVYICNKRMGYVIGSTIFTLVGLDLLRYGTVVGKGRRTNGFGAVRQSNEALDFIQRVILPVDYVSGCLVALLAHGCVYIEIDEKRGEPDFIFVMVQDRLLAATHIMANLPTEDELETVADKGPTDFQVEIPQERDNG